MMVHRIVALLAVVVVVFPQDGFAKPRKGERAALVIGLDYVDSEAWKLGNARNDAKSVARQLKRLKFGVTELVDAPGKPVDIDRFLATVEAFSNNPAPTKLIYFAGHGFQFSGESVLVSTDSTDTRVHGMALTSIVDMVGRKADRLLLFVDACRNTPMADHQPGDRGVSRRTWEIMTVGLGEGPGGFDVEEHTLSGDATDATHGLAKLSVVNVDEALIMFSTAPGQFAADGRGGNSPFTQAFVESIGDREEIITVAKNIIGRTQELTGNRQRPWITLQLAQDVFLAGKPLPRTVVPIDIPG